MSTVSSSKSTDFETFYKKDGEDLKYMESVKEREKMTPEQVANTFDKWVETGSYQTDVVNLKYSGPIVTSDMAATLFPTDRENVKIADLAAGTGMGAIQLRKRGFKKIDGVDPSPVSKDVAMASNLYDKYLVDFVDERRLDLKTDDYDCTFSSGGFAPGLMPCVALKEFIRLTKPGGYVCISVPAYIFQLAEEYKDRFEPLMEKYAQEGVWEKISKTVVDSYLDQKPGVIFVYKVLKSEVV